MKLIIFCTIWVLPLLVNSVTYKLLKLDNCTTTDENILAIDSCVVTASRVNITIEFKRPLTKFHVLIALFIKQDSEYKQLFKAPSVEWCALMSGKMKTNRFIRGLVEALKEKVPSLFKKCPYTGRYELFNLALNKKLISFYPSGTFRIDGTITDDATKAFATASLLLEINN